MPIHESARGERAAWLRLVLTPGIGPATARNLLAAVGAPDEILASAHTTLARVVGTELASAVLARCARREQAVEDALRWAEAPDCHLLALVDPDYPAGLLQIGDPPPLLFVRGATRRLTGPSLAVVGSRSASRGAIETAQAFARALGDAGLIITSGLALGVDTAAHRGALNSAGGTVAVLGTGVDTIYPRSNQALAEAILADGGAIVSELPLGTEARPANFPRRNRLIAGMSLGVLVVEATLRSGSLITARLAAEFGREVFAIPGSIHSPLARGCHRLIQQGAKLVETAKDILDELPVPVPADLFAAARSAEASAEAAAATEDPLLRALGWDPVSAEGLALRWREGRPGELAARLLALELHGSVELLADGRYQRRAPRA